MPGKYDIGATVGLEGESEFKRSLKEINGDLKELGSEMRVVTSEFIGNENSIEALTAANNQLGETSAALRSKIELLRDQLQKYADAEQLSTDAAQRLQIQLNNTTAEFNKNEAQIRKNQDEIDRLTEAENALGEETGLIGDLLQSLGIDLDGVSKALGLSKEQTTALSEAFNGGGLSLAAGAAAAAAGIALAAAAVKEITEFMAEAVKDATAYADSILTLSTNYHIATDTLQEYQYMAELTDTSLETITGSISKLTKSMNDARKTGLSDVFVESDYTNLSNAADAFYQLGISVTDSTGELRDSNEVFREVIDALGEINNETERDALSMQLFGRSAMDLNSLIAAGSEGMAAFAEEARNMGYVLSDDQLNALGELDDQFQRFDSEMTAIKNQIAAEAAPALTELAKQLLEVSQSIDWESFGKAAADVITELTPMIVDFAEAIANVANAISNLIEIGQSIKHSSSNTGVLYRNDGTLRQTSTSLSDYSSGSRSTDRPLNINLDGRQVASAMINPMDSRTAQRGKVL